MVKKESCIAYNKAMSADACRFLHSVKFSYETEQSRKEWNISKIVLKCKQTFGDLALNTIQSWSFCLYVKASPLLGQFKKLIQKLHSRFST